MRNIHIGSNMPYLASLLLRWSYIPLASQHIIHSQQYSKPLELQDT